MAVSLSMEVAEEAQQVLAEDQMVQLVMLRIHQRQRPIQGVVQAEALRHLLLLVQEVRVLLFLKYLQRIILVQCQVHLLHLLADLIPL